MEKEKSFTISRRQVWEAYKSVKANRGGAGIDNQSIIDFEEDMSNNLYKIWNRMSSGSYIPPPVKRVEIPKGEGKMKTARNTHSGRSSCPDGCKEKS